MTSATSARGRRVRTLATTLAIALAAASLFAGSRRVADRLVILSIVGTTDLHGRLFTDRARGGLALFGGYLANLRAARAADGGGVVLMDSGDTFQGGIESNLSEGAAVIDAYNALGYTALAVGNHDFEFGSVDTTDALDTAGADLRGALKARAAQAHFPFLAANLLEQGAPVSWPNVTPSAMVEIAGVRVGLVGVMTYDALSMTIAADVTGLATTPLAAAVEREASALRGRGAQVVIVASHAGGDCARVDAPTDLSSCDEWSEIFDVVRHLPAGLVDVVMAGHTHATVAHVVNGVAIAQTLSVGRGFSRVDLTVDAATGKVQSARILPPEIICAAHDARGECADPDGSGASPTVYEGQAVAPDVRIAAAMAPALARVETRRATRFGPALDAPVIRGAPEVESPLGNLFADAMRGATPGADAAITYGTGPGGLRMDLPAGPLTLGGLYDAFPFDNRVVTKTMTGAELRAIVAAHLQRPRWWARTLGLSGLHVRVACGRNGQQATIVRDSGGGLRDDETLKVVLSDFIAGRDRVRQTIAEDPSLSTSPLVRDLVTRWLRARPARLRAADFLDPARPRWQMDATSTDAGACQ